MLFRDNKSLTISIFPPYEAFIKRRELNIVVLIMLINGL